MEFFACIILIAVMYIICKAPEWKATNRVLPPGKEIDHGAIVNDMILKGYSNRDVAIKKNQGGYDVPIKKYDSK